MRTGVEVDACVQAVRLGVGVATIFVQSASFVIVAMRRKIGQMRLKRRHMAAPCAHHSVGEPRRMHAHAKQRQGKREASEKQAANQNHSASLNSEYLILHKL